MANEKKPPMSNFFEWDEDGYPVINEPEESAGSISGQTTDKQVVKDESVEYREFNIDELIKDKRELAKMLGRDAAARLIAMRIESESKGRIRYRDLGQDKIDED